MLYRTKSCLFEIKINTYLGRIILIPCEAKITLYRLFWFIFDKYRDWKALKVEHVFKSIPQILRVCEFSLFDLSFTTFSSVFHWCNGIKIIILIRNYFFLKGCNDNITDFISNLLIGLFHVRIWIWTSGKIRQWKICLALWHITQIWSWLTESYEKRKKLSEFLIDLVKRKQQTKLIMVAANWYYWIFTWQYY
jgi:hypothetical protein